MTGAGSAAYVWDARNRLTSAPGMAGAVYDFLGRRQHASFGADMASWLYDGGNPVQEASSVNGGAVVLNGLGLDRRFTRTEGANASTLLTDHLGSTLALTNASGAATTRYAYQPYGATTQSGAASDNPYQFTGRQNDGNGLYYYRARYYHPAIGRFISEDPIGLAGGVNLYGYAAQSPLMFRDPRGRDWADFRGYLSESWSSFSSGVSDYGHLLATDPGAALQEAAAAGLGIAPPLQELGALSRIPCPNSGGYALTRTVANNLATRPYLNSPLTIQEIQATGAGIPDPGGIPGALFFEVPGGFNGSQGTYQLVIDPENNIIYHFLYRSGK